MGHARHGHKCQFCDRTVYGNGARVQHGRGHVRHGEAVELVKTYPTYPPMSNRLFVPVEDTERVDRYLNEGFTRVR